MRRRTTKRTNGKGLTPDERRTANNAFILEVGEQVTDGPEWLSKLWPPTNTTSYRDYIERREEKTIDGGEPKHRGGTHPAHPTPGIVGSPTRVDHRPPRSM